MSVDKNKSFVVSHAGWSGSAELKTFFHALLQYVLRTLGQSSMSRSSTRVPEDEVSHWPARFATLFGIDNGGDVILITDGEWVGLSCGVFGPCFAPEVREAAGAFALVITAFMAERLNEDEWITNFPALESAFDITAARWLVRRAPMEARFRGLAPFPSDGSVFA